MPGAELSVHQNVVLGQAILVVWKWYVQKKCRASKHADRRRGVWYARAVLLSLVGLPARLGLETRELRELESGRTQRMLSVLVLVEFVVPITARAPADRGMGSGGQAMERFLEAPARLAWMEVDSVSQVRT